MATLMVMSSGGMRSLVAAAMTSAGHSGRLIFIHIKDQLPSAENRLEHTRRQARHFKAAHLIELELPHLPPPGVRDPRQDTRPPAFSSLMLLTALSHAQSWGVDRLVWPVQLSGRFSDIARAAEQMELVQHLAQLEGGKLPEVHAPLLELTDRELVELGVQLDVPWQLAWTCALSGAAPCRACKPCRRRAIAFDSLGAVDPILQPAGR